MKWPELQLFCGLQDILQLGPYKFGGHLVSHLIPYVLQILIFKCCLLKWKYFYIYPGRQKHFKLPTTESIIQLPPFKHVWLVHLTIWLHGGFEKPGGQQQ